MATASDLESAMTKFTKGKKEATSKEITKWFTDAKVLTRKSCSSNNLDIAFSKFKTKNVLHSKDLDKLIAEVAKAYANDKKMSVEDAIPKIKDLLASTYNPDFSSATKQSKVGGVDRMTDASKYTGSHKERFDESGKGKGIAGREDLADNSGYVGNYKGADTYDATH